MPRSAIMITRIPQAQFEARVPAHAQNDDLSVEVPSFKQIFDRDERLHLFIFARHPRACTRARNTMSPDRPELSVPSARKCVASLSRESIRAFAAKPSF